MSSAFPKMPRQRRRAAAPGFIGLPTLIRFVVILAVLAGAGYGALFWLATQVKVTPHEITERVELPKAAK